MDIVKIDIKTQYHFTNGLPHSFTMGIEGTSTDIKSVLNEEYILGFSSIPSNGKLLHRNCTKIDGYYYIHVKSGVVRRSPSRERNYYNIIILNYEAIMGNMPMHRIIKIKALL
jgi:hypothetical protein